MIPKTIHYCWFGNHLPDTVSIQCLESWKAQLPDFEIKCWNETNFDINANDYVKSAYEHGAWAFVSDYARVWILRHHGGIYLDTDMLLLKSLEDFLAYSCFLGCERSDAVSCGIIGAAPGHAYLAELDNYFRTLKFNPENKMLISSIFTKILSQKGFMLCTSITQIEDVTLFPEDYFYPLPFSHRGRPYTHFLTPNSTAVHLWGERWKNSRDFLREGNFKRAMEGLSGKRLPVECLSELPAAYARFLFVKARKNKALQRLTPWLKKAVSHLIAPLFINRCFNRALDLAPLFFFERRSYLIPSEHSMLLSGNVHVKKKGIRYKLNLKEHNGWRVYFNIFDRGTLRLFKLIQPHYNVVDVGANLGYYTLNMSARLYSGCIFAFEPDRKNYEDLLGNIKLNKFRNITPFQMALGAYSGYCNIRVINDKNLGMNRVGPPQNSELDIEMRTLDSLPLAEQEIHLIKIDVEGYEHEFLKGARQAISKYKPILFVEFCDTNLLIYSSSAKLLYTYIKNDLKYDYIINANTQEPIDEYTQFSGCFFDALCYDKGSLI
ncbi:MAG: hypothetical protein RI973_1392 [Bacteroidota bacterium]|jgi:FkbM family methyltransferase